MPRCYVEGFWEGRVLSERGFLGGGDVSIPNPPRETNGLVVVVIVLADFVKVGAVVEGATCVGGVPCYDVVALRVG